jgi:hypothetical protein
MVASASVFQKFSDASSPVGVLSRRSFLQDDCRIRTTASIRAKGVFEVVIIVFIITKY